MLSYNNIVEKGEPDHKEIIDHALGDHHGDLPDFCQKSVGEEGAVDCIVVENFLSEEECDCLIAACEKVGYTFWHQEEHSQQDGEAQCDAASKAVRVVDTIEATFPQLSKKLSDRIASMVKLTPKHFSPDMPNADEVFERDLEGTWVPYALSENLLFGRYHPGGHFMPHIDGSTIVDLNKRSFYTLLIYLNDCPAGGETHLFSGDQCKITYFDEESNKYLGSPSNRIGSVLPRRGSAAFFYYNLLHEASPVLDGLKYICRADLIYQRTPPLLDSENDRKAFEMYQAARLLESKGEAMEACKIFQKIAKVSRGVAELYQLD